MRHTGLAAIPKLSLPALRPVLLRFSLAFLLAGTQLFGWLSPFGLAAVAAAGSGVSGLSALLGCFAGAFSFLPFAPALRYSAIALLIFSCAVVFSGTALQRKSFFAPATAGAMTLAVGFAYVGQAGWAFSVLLRTLLESLLAAGGCLLLQAKLPARSVSRRSGARENALPALRGCLEKAAAAFRSLYDSFGQPAPGAGTGGGFPRLFQQPLPALSGFSGGSQRRTHGFAAAAAVPAAAAAVPGGGRAAVRLFFPAAQFRRPARRGCSTEQKGPSDLSGGLRLLSQAGGEHLRRQPHRL